MRKLKLQVQISVDGFIADIEGRTNWLIWKDWDEKWNWDDSLKKYFIENLESVDCILLSRIMAKEGFITHWTRAAENPTDPRFAYAKKINDTYKVVFTKTLEKSEWDNIDIAKGDLAEEINKLKNQDGKDIIVYGGASFVSSLIRAGLIDEYQIFINPTILGDGLAIFNKLDSALNLILIESKSFDCGIVVQVYKPKND